MSWTQINEAHDFTFPTSKIPTLSLAVTKGNLLIAWCDGSDGGSPYFIDDGLNLWQQVNTSSPVNPYPGGYGAFQIWWCRARRTTTLNLQFFAASASSSSVPVAHSFPAAQIVQFNGNGQLPFETANLVTGTSSTPTGSVVSANTTDLIVGVVQPSGGQNDSEGAGWTNAAGAGTFYSLIWKAPGSSGTFTPNYVGSSSGTWAVMSIVFRQPQTTFTISGSLGASGAGGIVYFISKTSNELFEATADGSGNYTSPGLEPDVYHIYPQVLGAIFTPNTQDATITNANVTGVNFTPTVVSTSLTLTPIFTDTMQRANENPLSDGGKWAVDGTPVPPWDPACQILSNQCVMADPTVFANFAGPWTGDGEMVLTGLSPILPTDHYMQMTVNALNSDWSHYGSAYCAVRSPANYTSAMTLIVANNGDGTAFMWLVAVPPGQVFPPNWFNNGQKSFGLWTLPAEPFNTGDTFALAAVGKLYYILHNGVIKGQWYNSGAALNQGTIVIELTGKSVSDAAITHVIGGFAQNVAGVIFTPLAQDPFARINENPLSDGGNWSAPSGINPLQLSGNTVLATTAGFNISLFTGIAFSNNQYAEAPVGVDGTGEFTGPMVRCSTTGGNGYWFLIDATGAIHIQRVVNSVGTSIASGTYTAQSPTTALMRLEVLGNQLTAKINGFVVLTATDNTYTSGHPGIGIFNGGSASMSGSFSAGNISVPTPSKHVAPAAPYFQETLIADGSIVGHPGYGARILPS